MNHRFEKEALVTTFLQNEISFPHKIINVRTRNVYEYPSLPFSTSALQKYCNHSYGWSPVVTMAKAQQLYEQGLITYHRTESQEISHDFKLEMVDDIKTKYGEKYVDMSKIENTRNKSKNLPHEAIRVTSFQKIKNNLLYDAIRKRSLQSVMSKAECKEQTISISSSNPEMIFEKRYKDITFEGFLILAPSKLERENAKEWVENTVLEYSKMESKEILVEMIKYYTEGSVISNLEQLGIGRPSTFASFVSKVQEKKYVEKLSKSIRSGLYLKHICFDKKKGAFSKTEEEYVREEKSKLFMTELGLQVVEYLYDEFPTFFEFEYTSSLEMQLDEIAKGTLKYKNLLKDVQKQLQTK